MKDSNSTLPKKNKPSVRQLREEQRARDAQKRMFLWIGAGVVILVLLGALVYSIVTAPAPQQIQGIEFFANIPGGQHVNGPIAYPQTPPVGGAHDPIWQNCGIYDRVIRSENAVHSMEHGAAWVTYQTNLPADQVKQLQDAVRGQSFVLLSPFEDLPSPVVASAWGAQLKLPNASDPRLQQFLAQYRLGPFAPERGASCQGGIGTPVG